MGTFKLTRNDLIQLSEKLEEITRSTNEDKVIVVFHDPLYPGGHGTHWIELLSVWRGNPHFPCEKVVCIRRATRWLWPDCVIDTGVDYDGLELLMRYFDKFTHAVKSGALRTNLPSSDDWWCISPRELISALALFIQDRKRFVEIVQSKQKNHKIPDWTETLKA